MIRRVLRVHYNSRLISNKERLDVVGSRELGRFAIDFSENTELLTSLILLSPADRSELGHNNNNTAGFTMPSACYNLSSSLLANKIHAGTLDTG